MSTHLSHLCAESSTLESVLEYLRERTAAIPSVGDEDEDEEQHTTKATPGYRAALFRYQDSDGRTALHWAIAMKNLGMAEALLSAPCHAPALTWDGVSSTTFLTACMVGAPEPFVLRLLKQCVTEYPTVMRRVTRRSEGEGKASAGAAGASGSSGQRVDEEGEGPCPLKRVESASGSAAEDEETERKRIESAIVSACDSMGNSPLIAVVSRGHNALVSLLLSHGADITWQNGQGQNVLHRAVSKGNFRLIELLVQHSEKTLGGAAHKQWMNAGDRRGDTPLFYAALEDNEEAGSFLLQHGANRHAKNKQGKEFWEAE